MHLASRAESYYIISEMGCWWEWILNKVPSAKQVILSAADLMRPICWGFALLFWIFYCLLWWWPQSKLFLWKGHFLWSFSVSDCTKSNCPKEHFWTLEFEALYCQIVQMVLGTLLACAHSSLPNGFWTQFESKFWPRPFPAGSFCICPPCFRGQALLVVCGMDCSLPAALNGRKWSWKT